MSTNPVVARLLGSTKWALEEKKVVTWKLNYSTLSMSVDIKKHRRLLLYSNSIAALLQYLIQYQYFEQRPVPFRNSTVVVLLQYPLQRYYSVQSAPALVNIAIVAQRYFSQERRKIAEKVLAVARSSFMNNVLTGIANALLISHS